MGEISVTELYIEDFTYDCIERGTKASYRLKLIHPKSYVQGKQSRMAEERSREPEDPNGNKGEPGDLDRKISEPAKPVRTVCETADLAENASEARNPIGKINETADSVSCAGDPADLDRGRTEGKSRTADNEPPIELDLPVLVVAGENEGPVLLVLAGVHGDEYEGVQTILRLYELLQPQQLNGRLILIPTANPLAYRAKSRCSPEDGMNLARTFPGKIDGTITERLAYEWHHRFIAKSDFLLDLHSGGKQYQIATLTGYYHDEQSELGRASRKAAEAFGIPLLWGHSHISAGRSISSAQALGIPWLYTEAYGGGRIRPEDAAYFLNGTLRLMDHLGMLKLNVAAELLLPKAHHSSFHTIYGDGNFDQSALCKQEGFFIPKVKLMYTLQAGERIGAIYDVNGQLIDEVYAEKSGFLVMLAGGPVVKKGDPLYMIA